MMFDEIKQRSGDMIGDVDLCQCYADRRHLVRMVELLAKQFDDEELLRWADKEATNAE